MGNLECVFNQCLKVPHKKGVSIFRCKMVMKEDGMKLIIHNSDSSHSIFIRDKCIEF
jgi:hypothetical protein